MQLGKKPGHGLVRRQGLISVQWVAQAIISIDQGKHPPPLADVLRNKVKWIAAAIDHFMMLSNGDENITRQTHPLPQFDRLSHVALIALPIDRR